MGGAGGRNIVNIIQEQFPDFYPKERFFSSVFRICSPGMQLWTHYDVSWIFLYFVWSFSFSVLYIIINNYRVRPGWEWGEGGT